MDKKYTNQKLAKDYFEVQTPFSSPTARDTYSTIKKRIASSNVDIAKYYEEHRSLRDLDVDGIGDKTKPILERLLSIGKKETIKELDLDRRIDELTTTGSKAGRRSKGIGDPSPSFENAVRIYEGH